MSAFIDLTGQRYGSLVVLFRVENDRFKRARWLCRCDCGKEIIVGSNNLRTGQVASCGCARASTLRKKLTTHGMTGCALYEIWKGIRQRCTNPHSSSFKNYGARGISICSEWNNFENFYNWGMSNGYKEGLSIDRIDVNGDYEPENCRWANKIQQANNTRRTTFIEYNGETHATAEWARKLGLSRKAFDYRLATMSIDDAMTRPRYAKKNRQLSAEVC